MSAMPYQYLTFSDLYEEEVRSSAPSSPVMAPASLSPVFLLPSTSWSTSHAQHRRQSHHLPLRPTRSHSQHQHQRRRTHADVHGHAMLKTFTQGSDHVAPAVSPATSSPSAVLHLDLFRAFKRKLSTLSKKHTSDSSALSTPTSSRRSSFSHGFASLHPVSAASSANTSPAISRQVTKNVSDYEAMLHNTARAQREEEADRQRQLQEYLDQAAQTGLSLRRF